MSALATSPVVVFYGLLQSFVEHAHNKGKGGFPPYYDRPWHEFLYELKLESLDKFPILSCIGEFDCHTGPYPKSEYLHSVMTKLLLNIFHTDEKTRRLIFDIRKQMFVEECAIRDQELFEEMIRVAESVPDFFV